MTASTTRFLRDAWPEAATRMAGLSAVRQRDFAVATCDVVLQNAGVRDAAVQQALVCLYAGQPVPQQTRNDLDALAQRLDDEGFDLHDLVDQRRADEQEYTAVFSQARAVSAVAFAARDAWTEALYEAAHAVDDRADLFRQVEERTARKRTGA